MSEDEFILVNRRRRRKKFEQVFREQLLLTECNEIEIDKETIVRKLFDAVPKLRYSVFKTHILHNISKALKILNVNKIFEIICYGLGQFSQHNSSKYQLALLLLLKRHYNCQVSLYDPAFLAKEIEILKELKLNVIETNEEGKHTISNNVTFIYMPHCPRQLINNFLYSNWNENLSNCILLTNSFSDIVEKSLKWHLMKFANYVLRIYPYMTEIKLKNDFKYTEVFSTTSIHIFTKQSLRRSSTMNSNVKIIRALAQELRHISLSEKLKDNITMQYILEQAYSHKETSEVLCKAQKELKNLAETYLCYLISQRKYKEIKMQYTGKGERSIKETADLVGFKLPHDPK
ncbi:SRR1-like protein [Vespula squamosa]|uniref:SRR1-like protein n=1 Tax=Vespula squamosa TaxID=30214 RepID=A0ABD2BDB2_VESSQ